MTLAPISYTHCHLTLGVLKANVCPDCWLHAGIGASAQRHPLTDIPTSAPGIEHKTWFPEFFSLQFPAGKQVMTSDFVPVCHTRKSNPYLYGPESGASCHILLGVLSDMHCLCFYISTSEDKLGTLFSDISPQWIFQLKRIRFYDCQDGSHLRKATKHAYLLR